MPQKLIGTLVLLLLAVSYLGTLFVSGRAFLVALLAFIFTFAVGMARQHRARSQQPRQGRTSRPEISAKRWALVLGRAQQDRARGQQPRQDGTSRPEAGAKRAAIGVAAVAVILSVVLLAFLSWGWGAPEIGERPLLAAREHYVFNNHGTLQEAERWRFIAVGLAFHTGWSIMACAAAFSVFFSSSPPGNPRSASCG